MQVTQVNPVRRARPCPGAPPGHAAPSAGGEPAGRAAAHTDDRRRVPRRDVAPRSRTRMAVPAALRCR